MSRPRAATSVATSTLSCPLRKRARTRSRASWLRSPLIASAAKPRLVRALASSPAVGAGADEDQRAGQGLHFKEARQRRQLVRFLNQVGALFDGFDGHLLALDGDGFGIGDVAGGQTANLGRQGGRKESGLAIGRCRCRSSRYPRQSPCSTSHRLRPAPRCAPALRSSAPRPSRSSSRPGVPTTTSMPLRSRLSCRPYSCPP